MKRFKIKIKNRFDLKKEKLKRRMLSRSDSALIVSQKFSSMS